VADTLKKRVLGGDVIFNLTNNYDGSTEAYPISFLAPSNSPYTVTIRPATGTTARVTAGDPGSTNSVINIDGASNIILDGRPGGVGNQSEWLIRNTRSATTVGS